MPSTGIITANSPKPKPTTVAAPAAQIKPAAAAEATGYEAQRAAVRPKPAGGNWFTRLFGGQGAGKDGGKIQSPELKAAIADAKSNPDGILRARQLIEQMGDQLPPAERAEAYRQLAAAPSYRSQRDNAKDPDSTCNFTSQAMAFETLGVNYHEAARGKQAERALANDNEPQVPEQTAANRNSPPNKHSFKKRQRSNRHNDDNDRRDHSAQHEGE